MTHRTIGGLTFDVSSPSLWQLHGYPVFIAYANHEWRVQLVHPDFTSHRIFATFAEAIDLVVQALGQRRAS